MTFRNFRKCRSETPVSFADGTSPNNTRSWQVGGSYDLQIAKFFAHVGDIVNHADPIAQTTAWIAATRAKSMGGKPPRGRP